MFSLSDITRQDDTFKLFKPWWEVLKEYLLYGMLLLTFVINGFRLSQERFICMPVTEGNDTCRYMDNISHSSCIIIEEIKSRALSEYISLACAQHVGVLVKYFDLILLIFPLFIYGLGVIFYNIPLILYKFKDIHSIISRCNDDDVKALVTKLDMHIDKEMWKRQPGECSQKEGIPNKTLDSQSVKQSNEDTLKEALDLQSIIQSTLKLGSYFGKDIAEGNDYHKVPTEAESNISSEGEENPRKSRWFLFAYIMYTFFQFATFVAYIFIIVLAWNELDHESKCVLKETYGYKYDFFLCRHSLRRIYQNLSFLLLILSAVFIVLIFIQSYLLKNGYRSKIREHLDTSVLDVTEDQRLILTFVYFCKQWYFRNFCRLFNKDLYRKIHSYIADCKYPFNDVTYYVKTHKNSLKLENISALPFSMTRVSDIILLEIVKSDLSTEDVLSPLKDLGRLQQLILNHCNIQIFDVESLPEGIVLLDVLSNPLKKIIGKCPKSLKLCILVKEDCSMKWNNFENVVILCEKVIRRNAPVNWNEIYTYLKLHGREQFTNNSGEIHIYNNKVSVDDSGKITNVERSCDHSRALESCGCMKDVVFLSGVFNLLNFDVHLKGSNKHARLSPKPVMQNMQVAKASRVIIVVSMGDNGNNDINTTVMNDIANRQRLSSLTPIVFISLTNGRENSISELNLTNSVWNICYASVPQASFLDNLIRYLNSDDEDDIAGAMEKWQDSIVEDRLYNKFYLRPGFPWLDTNVSLWTFECTEEERKYRELITTVDQYHLRAQLEDVTTSMADMTKLSAVQKSIGRIKLADRQITCCMISDSWVLVAYPDISSLIDECKQTNPLCAEFKIGENMETFHLEQFSDYNYKLGIACVRLKKGDNNLPEPVVLDFSNICDKAFVMGYPEELDSGLILESQCQVYTEQPISMGARNPDDTNGPPHDATTNQPILERDVNNVQKLWIKRYGDLNCRNEYENLLIEFRRNNIYVIRLPTKFTEVCKSALVVCLDVHNQPCVKAFYNQRYPESIYRHKDVVKARELLFQGAVKSFNVQKYVNDLD